jgi:DNA (cytosine-5)-methyltransferase 1
MVPVSVGRSLKTVGLFAGIGGLELGFQRSGHQPLLMVENNRPAAHVLRTRFPDVKLEGDVRELRAIPRDTDLLLAGFPCQDLSSSGLKAGISGGRSGLVNEVLRLAHEAQTPWLVLENVPFLLSLNGGAALHLITQELTRLGYRWAYRVVDSNSFGLPQRRNRWYLVASRHEDPRPLLLGGDVLPERPDGDYRDYACGFYWTEGMRALGWTVDGVPPIKCGSSVGVASPPAIRLPGGAFRTPDIRDAERLQGFDEDWTAPALEVARPGERWRLVGNAVSVPAAEWLGRRVAAPPEYDASQDLEHGGPRWPRKAAWADHDGVVHAAEVGPWPVWVPRPNMSDFLRHPGKALSGRAARGFLARTQKGSLRFPDGLLSDLEQYAETAP